jgi:hypothetical protein
MALALCGGPNCSVSVPHPDPRIPMALDPWEYWVFTKSGDDLFCSQACYKAHAAGLQPGSRGLDKMMATWAAEGKARRAELEAAEASTADTTT